MPFSIPPGFFHDETTVFHQGSKVAQLEVNSSETEIDLANGYVIYRGGVMATYGVSKISADTLIVRKGVPGELPVDIVESGQTISMRPNEAIVFGNVKIVDPDGTLNASKVWFTWDEVKRSEPETVTGFADDVQAQIATSHINASKVTSSNAGLSFRDVSFWTGNWKTPLFRFESESLFVYPGKKGVAKHLKLTLLGVPLPQIAEYTFSLDPRSSGLSIPTIGFRQDAGVGLSWVGNIPISDSTAIAAALTTFPKVQPTYTLSYVKSNVEDENVGLNQLSVTGLWGERSPYSFFGSIYSTSIASAHSRMGVKKRLFSLSSTFNYETLGRTTDRIINYSQPIEIGLENGGLLGNWAYMFNIKGSKIVEDGNKSASRLSLTGSTFAPLVKSGNFVAGTRFDGLARIDASSSGYLGVETGFSYDAYKDMTLSAGAYGYKSFGKSLFQGDTFRTNQGYVVRGDWLGSSTKVSLMFKYDPTQGWFDREYRLSQVMGPIEPVLVYRVSPRQYVFGVRFRTQDISKMLQSRKLRRNNELPTQGDR